MLSNVVAIFLEFSPKVVPEPIMCWLSVFLFAVEYSPEKASLSFHSFNSSEVPSSFLQEGREYVATLKEMS